MATNNLFYFDRYTMSSPPFYSQGGCTYSGGFPYTDYQRWNNNLYWRTDGAFINDTQAFHVQSAAGPANLCSKVPSRWTFYSFSDWQQNTGEDAQSVVQDPGFTNPTYPADDFSLRKGSPGVGFVVFDPNQAGRFETHDQSARGPRNVPYPVLQSFDRLLGERDFDLNYETAESVESGSDRRGTLRRKHSRPCAEPSGSSGSRGRSPPARN